MPKTVSIGDSLQGYEILEQVASGKQADVFRAEQDDQTVAVKVYKGNKATSMRQRIERESRSQSAIQHKNVARFIGTGESGTNPFLISEWIDGETLEARLSLAMQSTKCLSIVDDVANGLAAIHAAGVIHRDIKPSNIMLTASRAVILDFGHCLSADELRITEGGQALGSAHYMAPEQSLGQSVDARADIYSLGVVLYRCLTGVLPFVGDVAAEVMAKHFQEVPLPPSERAPDRTIPKALDDLCMWMLMTSTQQRLPNARVLRLTIDALDLNEVPEGRVA